VLHSHFWD